MKRPILILVLTAFFVGTLSFCAGFTIAHQQAVEQCVQDIQDNTDHCVKAINDVRDNCIKNIRSLGK